MWTRASKARVATSGACCAELVARCARHLASSAASHAVESDRAAQHTLFARLLHARHVALATAAAVDLMQSAHQGPRAYLRTVSRQGC